MAGRLKAALARAGRAPPDPRLLRPPRRVGAQPSRLGPCMAGIAAPGCVASGRCKYADPDIMRICTAQVSPVHYAEVPCSTGTRLRNGRSRCHGPNPVCVSGGGGHCLNPQPCLSSACPQQGCEFRRQTTNASLLLLTVQQFFHVAPPVRPPAKVHHHRRKAQPRRPRPAPLRTPGGGGGGGGGAGRRVGLEDVAGRGGEGLGEYKRDRKGA